MRVVIEMEEDKAATGLAVLRNLDFITSVYETDADTLMEERLKSQPTMSMAEARKQAK